MKLGQLIYIIMENAFVETFASFGGLSPKSRFLFSFFLSGFSFKGTDKLTLLVPTPLVKHTQAIRQQKPTNCLVVFDHFVGWFIGQHGKERDYLYSSL